MALSKCQRRLLTGIEFERKRERKKKRRESAFPLLCEIGVLKQSLHGFVLSMIGLLL
jgi:hypothetical protein